MSEWRALKGSNAVDPPEYRNVLVAFKEHWNQVVCFYTGSKSGWYQTTAHDNNQQIAKPDPDFWAEIPEVPHRTDRGVR